MADGLYPCCAEPENLVLQPQPDPARPELSLRVCGACGRRHFELEVEPLELDLTGQSL